MLSLWSSNRLESLAEALAGRLAATATDPLAPREIVVPNGNVATYAKLRIAHHNGIAANLSIDHWEPFLTRLLGDGPRRLLTRRAVTALLVTVLADPAELERIGAAEVQRYLSGERELHAYQLAARLSTMFEEYHLGRPEMIAAWRRGRQVVQGPEAGTEAWQSALWRRLFGPGGLRETLQENMQWVLPGEIADVLDHAALPPQVRVFGFSYLPRGYLTLLRALADRVDVDLFAFAPVRPPVEAGGDLHLALKAWGRPGLEHAGLLAQVKPDRTHALFSAPPERAKGKKSRHLPDGSVQLTLFAEPAPAGETFLQQLRLDIERGQRPADDNQVNMADGSLSILACPSIQREVEVVAGKIWALLRAESAAGRTLRFNDIALIIADTARFDVYESHIRAVFQDVHGIPASVSDARPASAGRVLEAIELLIALPEGQFRRPELLRLLAHPALLARFGRTDAEDWKRWCERTAIYFGADQRDLAGLYVDRDLLSWDQGLRRLALGAFLGPAAGGEPAPFALGGQEYLPEPLAADELPSAALLTMLVRALVGEARAAREARTLTEWSQYYSRLVTTYLAPTDEGDEMLIARARRALGELAQLDLSGRPVPARIAAELAREALERVPGGRGHYLADGVVVSSLQPMRPIPFPVAFIVGLGEGCFPGAEGLDALDLRRAQRGEGDVTARERDQYLFLEAVVSTTHRLYLSYVSRDARTGEESNPSSVLEELLWMVQQGYHGGKDPRPVLVERHPLRRWDEDPAAGRLVLPPRARREAALAGLARPELVGLTRRQRVELLRGDPETARRWLGLIPIPTPAPAPAGARVELPLLALRRFLECPLQGWARAVLRLVEEDVSDVVASEDEPLAAEALSATILLGQVFRAELARGKELISSASLDRAWQAAADRGELAGQLPSGPFGRAERGRLRAILDNWRAGVDGEFELQGSIEPTRFGRADEGAQVGDIYPAIELALTDPHGQPIVVSLYGSTQPVDGSGRYSLRMTLREQAQTADHLGAWIDHMALAAAGLSSGERMTSMVLVGSRKPRTATFEPVTPAAARAYLSALVTEMLWTAHAYFLPLEAAEQYRKSVGAESLREICADLRADEHKAVRSDRGPVPHARGYEAPAEQAGREMVRRRLGGFFTSLPPEPEEDDA